MMIPLLCSASVLLCLTPVTAQPTTDQCIRNNETDRQVALETRDLLMSLHRRLQTIEDRQELMERRLLSITQLVEENNKDTRCRLSEDGKRKCYKLILQKMTWSESRAYCQSHAQGADLVSIESQEENTFLVDMLRGMKHNCIQIFTSGKRDSNGEWIWQATGQPFTYTGWYPPQPDNSGGVEDACTLVYTKSGYNIWNDHPHTAKHCLICEFS